MIDLFKAAPHIRLHRGATMVIKVGGGALARPANVRQFARQVSILQALGARVVIVHGGGPQTDALQRLLGEEPRMVDGRRVTSPIGLRALRMATLGELNSELAAALTAEGAPAAGDGQGGFLNVNADLAAASIAVAMKARKLVLATGAPGILRDANDAHSLVSALTLSDLISMEASGALQAGMKVKAKAIRIALEGGVGRVHVVSGSDPEALLVELYTTQGAGTLVTLEPERAPEPTASLSGASA